MRLHPEVSHDEALTWLKNQVNELQLSSTPADLEAALTATAEAMATISRTVLPDEIEPYFP